MGDLKPVSHKQFNEFIKGKGFKERNDHKLKELKAKFGFKPMYDRRMLVQSTLSKTDTFVTPKSVRLIEVSVL